MDSAGTAIRICVLAKPFNRQHVLTGNRKLDLQFNQDRSTSSTFSPGIRKLDLQFRQTVQPATRSNREPHQTVQPATRSNREPQAGLAIQTNRSTSSTFSPGTASWTCSSDKPFNRQHVLTGNRRLDLQFIQDRSTSSTFSQEPQAGLAVQPRPFNQQHILTENHKLDLQFNQDRSTGSTFSPRTASWTCSSAKPFNQQHVLTENRKLDLLQHEGHSLYPLVLSRFPF